jgi:LAS superfamily LD-carboxypeptidase LdcB
MTHSASARTTSRRTPGPLTVGLLVVITGIVGTLVHQAATASAPEVTEADGVLPDRVTVFDEQYPGITNLDPDLLRALREAATKAADDGITVYVNSGWRSRAYQDELLHEAVSTYGSEAEAARWVATPDTSPHVSGEAVDVGDTDATSWLSRHGAEEGLCQIYRNEPWHVELRPAAVGHGCPPVYADPTQDPRMQP